MEKFILAPDSYKGNLSAVQICEIMGEVISNHKPDAQILSVPVADGGEGTVDCFLTALEGERAACRVSGPFGEKIDSFYGLFGERAVVEMAACAGLPLAEGRANPEVTTTYGVGELILDAIGRGAREVILAIGGSATNDGGAGMASALGYRFIDASGEAFVPTGGTLGRVASIDNSNVAQALGGVRFTAMCDVNNPLCGENGAAAIFGPQKGADPDMVLRLDQGLGHLAGVIERDLHADIRELPGAGAAGGLGGGARAFLGAQLKSGIDTVLDTVGFDGMLDGCSWVLTGEGRIDGQSLRGKVVVGVARRAKKQNVPVLAVVGDIADDITNVYAEGVTAVLSTNRVAKPYEAVRARAPSDLALTVDTFIRLLGAI